MPARSFLDCPVFEGNIDPETVEGGPVDYPAFHTTQDVVISGVSCRLPESESMAEYRDNLMNGIDMVTDDDRRWKPGRVAGNRNSLSSSASCINFCILLTTDRFAAVNICKRLVSISRLRF